MSKNKKLKEGEVYYYKKENKFMQCRSIQPIRVVFGDLCNYYNDAKTTGGTLPFSTDIINELALIEIEHINKIGYGIHNDGIGYCVKVLKP